MRPIKRLKIKNKFFPIIKYIILLENDNLLYIELKRVFHIKFGG